MLKIIENRGAHSLTHSLAMNPYAMKQRGFCLVEWKRKNWHQQPCGKSSEFASSCSAF